MCEEALGAALAVDAPEGELAGNWTAEEVPAAAELLRYYGQALLFAPDAASMAHGRQFVIATLALLDAAGRPTVSLHAWFTYLEVLLFLRSPDEAIRAVRLAVHQVAELGHTDGAVRLAELATVEFFVGDNHAARATIERARDFAQRTGRSASPSRSSPPSRSRSTSRQGHSSRNTASGSTTRLPS